MGRMVRFDSVLLFLQLQAKMQGGESLKPERTDMFFRYQRGFVYQKGRNVKVWYGRIREDVRDPDGQIERRHRNIRLGTLDELPTKSAARKRLSELLKDSHPKTEMSFRDLAERWEKAEGSTIKATTLHHYKNALRAYVLPRFGDRKIAEINREDIQTFLAEKSLHSCETAEANGREKSNPHGFNVRAGECDCGEAERAICNVGSVSRSNWIADRRGSRDQVDGF